MLEMKNVKIMNHPLITHKMSILRCEDTKSKEFKELIKEITSLMLYEVMKDADTKDIQIKTPLQNMKTKCLKNEHLIFIPILRAGLGMVDGVINMLPTARFGHIGLYRDEKTLKPVEYYCKLPSGVENQEVILLDPMLATGGSAVDAITLIKKRNPSKIKFMCIVASPKGLKTLCEAHSNVEIFCAVKDEALNENGYILPGLGDAGDRIFGTV